jgi:HlyD family secretion protein
MAPMDGLITSRKAEMGTTLSPGTPIFQMVALETVWVAAWIDQSQISQIKEGQPAAILLRSGRQYRGQVSRITTEADTVTHELEVDVKFDRLPEPLVIGEEAEVDIDTGTVKAPAVPLTAITERDNKTVVLAVDQGRLVFRPVKPGLNDGKRIAILEGLKEGDLVVAQPANLKPGTRVQPEVNTPEAKKK